MSKQFVITAENLEAIELAIVVLREHIQARGLQTEASINETRSALAGLLNIFPKPQPTWSPDGGGNQGAWNELA